MDLRSTIAFEDLAAVRDLPALKLRIGPARSHEDLTFGDLRDAAVAAAGAFAAAGCRPGERVALLMPSSRRLVAGFFGALYGGMVPSILAWPTTKMDPEKYRRNVVAVVAGLDADWLVTDAATAERLGTAVGRARVLDPSVAERAPLAFATAPLAEPRPAAVRETAFIQFSGGTTGTQKSVPISYEKLGLELAALTARLGVSPADHVVSWLPLYHDMGLVACLLLPFLERIPVTLFSPLEWVMDPRPFLEAIGRERATLCWMPNFAFAFLAAKGKAPPGALDLSSLRAAVNCSEPVRAASADAFLERFQPHGFRPEALLSSYALAEAVFAVTQATAGDPPRRLRVAAGALGEGRIQLDEGGVAVVSSGRPMPGIEVLVTGAGGRPAASGEIGEVWLRGPWVMDDYLGGGRRPFTEDGFYRTGDRGALVDGHLFVTGRARDLIIIGGVNIHPEDLEDAVSGIEGLHAGRAVALGLDDEQLGTERLVVVAEVSSGEDLARAAAIEAEVRRASLVVCGVAPYKVFLVPPQWILKSTAGKVARAETKARLLSRWAELTAPPPEP